MLRGPLLWVGLVLLFTVFSFKSLVRPGYFPMHDDMQVMRVLQLDKCIKDGQVPCRWVPDMGYGYGYPQFIYYAPLPYYVMEGFHLTGLSILDSVKAGFILSFLLSGLSMFLLGKALWGNFGGTVSALFYIYAPYRASDVYTRGAVGEFWALIFLPFIIWVLLELIRQEKFRYVVLLALAYGGLLITHNLTTMMFTPVIVAWGIFLMWYYKKLKMFPNVVFGLLWGIFLAGFFILPVILEKRFAHVETMTYGYFNYLAHFASLSQLFLSTHWGFGSSELGPYDDLSFSVGPFHWIVALLSLIVALYLRKKEKNSIIVFFFFALGIFSTFLAHQRSVFIWDRLPFMSYFQFPWRFLTIVIFAFSVAAGFLISSLKIFNNRVFMGIVIIIGLILLNAFYFHPREWYMITDKEKFSGELWDKQRTISIFDYLPIFVKTPPGSPAPAQPRKLSGEVIVIDYEKGTDWQKGKINVLSDTVLLEVPLFYFPGFKAWVDGKETPVTYTKDIGLVNLQIPKGKHEIFIKLTNTNVRTIGNLMTILGLTLLIFSPFRSRLNNENN